MGKASILSQVYALALKQRVNYLNEQISQYRYLPRSPPAFNPKTTVATPFPRPKALVEPRLTP